MAEIEKPNTPKNVVDDFVTYIRNKYKEHFITEFDGMYGKIEGPKAGFNMVVKSDGTVVADRLYLKPESQKKGIGTEIMQEMFEWSNKNNQPFEFVLMAGYDDLSSPSRTVKIQKAFQEKLKNITGLEAIPSDQGLMGTKITTYKYTPLDTPTNVVDDIKPGGSLGAAKLNDPLVFDSWIDNYTKTTTSFIDNLPLSTTVKNQFDNLVRGRIKNLATPGGVADAVDVWELGVLGLMIAAVAYKEYDEVPKILTNKAVDMFNSMTAPYNIPPVPKEQYDLDYEFINKVVETGEKFMPTDIIIKKVGEVIEGVGEKGLATGFGYVPTTPEKTDTMETKQKIQPGVQEEKMFEQAKPKKVKSGGGSGARIL
jgi:hypothetical protein